MFALQCVRRLHTSTFSFGSALYVTGQKATETFAFLTPHLDWETRFNDVPLLQQNVNARGMDIDVEKLKKSWEFLKSVQKTKNDLEVRREETAKKIKSLMQQKSVNTDRDIKPLKILGKTIRDNLKVISKEIWALEETVIMRFLALPNNLHPDTPIDSEVIITEHGSSSNMKKQSRSHIEIGEQLGLIKYWDPSCYFLEHAAAKFELAITQFVADIMHKKEFLLSSNADFSKSLVIEGCGIKHTDANSVFILQSTDDTFNEDNCLHLVGGSSAPSFCALFTKQETFLSHKPLKLFILGRHYTPKVNSDVPSLFEVAQSTTAEIFIAGPNCEVQTMESINYALTVVTDIYNKLGLHYRVVKCSAKQLQPCESLKFSVQMFSCHLQNYVEVGYVSNCDTFLSKRLLMQYQDTDGNKDFLSIVTGRAIHIPRVLACILEEKGSLVVPEVIDNIWKSAKLKKLS